MRMARLLLGPIGICGILALPGCGGSDKVTTQPTPTPTPAPVRSLVTKGTVTISGPDDKFTYFQTITFTTPSPGTLEVIVDWTYPTNTLWMFVSSGVCTAQQFQSCPDIDGIRTVINYELPDSSDAYVHRVGRTGRADEVGQAITLVAPGGCLPGPGRAEQVRLRLQAGDGPAGAVVDAHDRGIAVLVHLESGTAGRIV